MVFLFGYCCRSMLLLLLLLLFLFLFLLGLSLFPFYVFPGEHQPVALFQGRFWACQWRASMLAGSIGRLQWKGIWLGGAACTYWSAEALVLNIVELAGSVEVRDKCRHVDCKGAQKTHKITRQTCPCQQVAAASQSGFAAYPLQIWL